MSRIKIQLNGTVEQVESTNLEIILNTFAPKDRPFAVEINGEIVPSAKFSDYSIPVSYTHLTLPTSPKV